MKNLSEGNQAPMRYGIAVAAVHLLSPLPYDFAEMIRKNTLLIVGAGASVPYGFPTGESLMRVIPEMLNAPESEIRAVIRAAGGSDDDLDKLSIALRETQFNSIDLLLEHRPALRDIGKLAIAAVLIPCEVSERLRPTEQTDHWYRLLFNNLLTSSGYSGGQLSVITLNYDRSLEEYLFSTVRTEFQLSTEEAAELVQQTPVLHLHGQLGLSSWRTPTHFDRYPKLKGGPDDLAKRAFEPNLTGDSVTAAASTIIIPSEFESHHISSAMVDTLMRDVEVVGFLGFGYHEPILERLGVSRLIARARRPKFFGSGYGLPEGRRQELKSMFPDIVMGGVTETTRQFLNSCGLLFQSN
jgi:hypothetical protein